MDVGKGQLEDLGETLLPGAQVLFSFSTYITYLHSSDRTLISAGCDIFDLHNWPGQIRVLLH